MLSEYVTIFWLMIAACGAAMFFGTAAAIYQHRRTGRAPGGAAAGASAPDTRSAVIKCSIGLIIIVVGLAGAARNVMMG